MYMVDKKNEATLHFPEYIANYTKGVYIYF